MTKMMNMRRSYFSAAQSAAAVVRQTANATMVRPYNAGAIKEVKEARNTRISRTGQSAAIVNRPASCEIV
jgi:hypothetical protein